MLDKTIDESRLMRARGLKHKTTLFSSCDNCVAPHAGAWIETEDEGFDDHVLSVAPHAGAWIETLSLLYKI